MAYIPRRERGALNQTMYSRWHSPDRRLYTHAETLAIGWDVHHQWWIYNPDGHNNPRTRFHPLLPVRALTAEAREGLERILPF